MWSKKDPHALLVLMQIGAITVENSTEFLKKLKIELPYGPAIPLLAIYFKKSQILIRKGICIPCV